MEITITPRPIRGKITAIASKSIAHRLLICAALSDKETDIFINESSEDIDATARCLNALGANIARTEDGFSVSPIKPIVGVPTLDCGESGSTLRFILPVVGALGVNARLKLAGRLPSRPLSPLWEELENGGMTLSWENETTLLCGGKLKSGAYSLPGNISSQFISGLLFALPLLSGDSTLLLTGKTESVQYMKMTLAALEKFGITFPFSDSTFKIEGEKRPSLPEKTSLMVEGDWSNAAFWLSAGALSGQITVDGLSASPLQGDKEIINLLKRFGAALSGNGSSVTACGGTLRGIEIDAAQIPDLVPILAVVASAAEGETKIYGAARLRLKESDRLKTVSNMLTALGGNIRETEDGLIIKGGTPLSGGTVDSAGDHRIAMSAAIASILCNGTVTIKGAEAVSKSYPKFWEHFSALGGRTERRETK